MTTEIATCLSANYPILYIGSPEEDRVVAEIEHVCIGLKRKLWLFSISSGLWNIAHCIKGRWRDIPARKINGNLRDPIAVLEHIKNAPATEGTFLLLDFHEFLGDIEVRRHLRDLFGILKSSQKNVIILSPVVAIPQALEHCVHIIDFPFPTKEALSTSLNETIQALTSRKIPVKLTRVEHERLVTAGQGLTLNDFENALAKAVVTNRRMDITTLDDIIAEKKQIIRKTGLLEFFDAGETMQHVGGLNALKGWLSKRQSAYTKKAIDYGLPTPKGILLLGVQGGGKSLTAKACAALWRFPLLRLDTGQLFVSQVGGSEERTRRVVQIAEALSPCILWIDEIEKAMAGVGSSSQSDAGTAARVFATMATWLQEKTAPVFVIATANRVDALPPELLRKGRWDEIFFVDLPGKEEREEIFRIHLEKRKRNPRKFDLGKLADSSDGFSGAEIEQAIIAGLYDAFDEDRPMSTRDIQNNLQLQVPLSQTMAEQVQGLREWARTRARWASDGHLSEERKRWRQGEIRSI